jgi:hypothetical protein
VEFTGGSSSAVLIGGGPVAAVARGGREAEGSRGSEAAARRAWQAGPAAERRGSEVATHRQAGGGSRVAEHYSLKAAGEWIGATCG